MQWVRELWNAFRNIAIILSFIMNLTLIIILGIVIFLIFDIKNGIAEPLIDGLHANFVGLNEAEIETTVMVNDHIPIDFDLTVQDTTIVTLAEPAVINDVPAVFEITGGGGTISGAVDITLPQGTPLTIDLTLLVPVEQQIPIQLPVPVQIALKDTQLSEPFINLRELFAPYVRALDNLPSSWDEVPDFTLDALGGEVDLTRETEGSRNPWPIEKDEETQDDGGAEPGGDQQPTDDTGDDEPGTSDGDGDGTPTTPMPQFSPTPTITPFAPPASTEN